MPGLMHLAQEQTSVTLLRLQSSILPLFSLKDHITSWCALERPINNLTTGRNEIIHTSCPLFEEVSICDTDRAVGSGDVITGM